MAKNEKTKSAAAASTETPAADAPAADTSATIGATPAAESAAEKKGRSISAAKEARLKEVQTLLGGGTISEDGELVFGDFNIAVLGDDFYVGSQKPFSALRRGRKSELTEKSGWYGAKVELANLKATIENTLPEPPPEPAPAAPAADAPAAPAADAPAAPAADAPAAPAADAPAAPAAS